MSDGFIRLHITPLDHNLFEIYLTANQRSLATNVSYHNILTYPESRYGYLALPTMEAEKVRKKLNGSIVKGTKVRVEEAKPEKRKADGIDGISDAMVSETKSKKSKSKRGSGSVVEGFELPEGRKVKRGWTETAAESSSSKKSKSAKKSRKSEKSKFSSHPELLFKTSSISQEELTKPKSKSSKKKNRETIVHEFKNSKKHSASFLNPSNPASQTRIAVEFVEGKGWLDESGDVIEGANPSRKITTTSRPKNAPSTPPDSPDIDAKQKEDKETKDITVEVNEPEVELETAAKSLPAPNPSNPSHQPNASDFKLKSAMKSIKIKTLSSPNQATDTIHPLEAIFKRTPNRPAPLQIEFSFFPPDSDVNADVEEAVTRTTFNRGLRSGAPTPDTGAAFRHFSFPQGAVSGSTESEGEDEVDSDEDEDSNRDQSFDRLSVVSEGKDDDDNNDAGKDSVYDCDVDDDLKNSMNVNSSETKEETAFSKWFWENRGNNNRAWKKDRKYAMKEKRNRENRRIGNRVF